MSDDITEIRHEMAATRDRMSRDIDELRARASEPLHSVKRRLDMNHLVGEHPWVALGAAVALGAVVAGSGADEKAASATVAGAKRAASASKDAAASAMEKLHDGKREPETISTSTKRSIGERVFDALGVAIARNLDRVVEDLRVASRDWGARRAAPQRQPLPPHPHVLATAAAAVAAHEQKLAATTSPADEVPVPKEMMPTEVDLRADTVEALGGGTHEPPLAPGAGDLGARWA